MDFEAFCRILQGFLMVKNKEFRLNKAQEREMAEYAVMSRQAENKQLIEIAGKVADVGIDEGVRYIFGGLIRIFFGFNGFLGSKK